MLLLKAFIRDPASIGAISPSSQSLARAMTSGLTVGPGEVVVELGPGTGALTAQIRRIIPDSSNYFGVEREPIFVEILRQRFPDLRIVNSLAEKAGDMYKASGLKLPKAIISGVPSSTQSRKTLDSIIGVLDQMMVYGSVFRTFQYVHAFPLPSARHFRRKMDTFFGPHRRGRVVIKNLPPAVVLTWQKSERPGNGVAL